MLFLDLVTFFFRNGKRIFLSYGRFIVRVKCGFGVLVIIFFCGIFSLGYLFLGIFDGRVKRFRVYLFFGDGGREGKRD